MQGRCPGHDFDSSLILFFPRYPSWWVTMFILHGPHHQRGSGNPIRDGDDRIQLSETMKQDTQKLQSGGGERLDWQALWNQDQS